MCCPAVLHTVKATGVACSRLQMGSVGVEGCQEWRGCGGNGERIMHARITSPSDLCRATPRGPLTHRSGGAANVAAGVSQQEPSMLLLLLLLPGVGGKARTYHLVGSC